jgi:hypothetical protein
VVAPRFCREGEFGMAERRGESGGGGVPISGAEEDRCNFRLALFHRDKLASTRQEEGRDVHWGEANGDVLVFLLPNIAIIPFPFFAESVATTGAESWNISNTLVRSFAGLSRFGVEGADGRLVDLCRGGD